MLIKINNKILFGLELPLQFGGKHEAHGALLRFGGRCLFHFTIVRIFSLIIRTIKGRPLIIE